MAQTEDGDSTSSIVIQIEDVSEMMGTLQPQGLDSQLISACSAFVALEHERQRLCAVAQDVEIEDEIQRQIARTDQEHEDWLDRLCRYRAHTREGLKSKALALLAWDTTAIEGTVIASQFTSLMLASILRDLIR